MRKEESRTELGTVGIHHQAIASLVSIACLEVEGVKAIGRGFALNLRNVLGRKDNPALGIKVGIDKNNEVKISIPLIMKYGFNIPEISAGVQENVSNALEKMTNLSIKDIHINIVGIERG